MSESFILASEFETASNAVNSILGQPVEEIEITDILPPFNDIADSNKVFKGKLSVLFVDMRKSTDLTDELISKKKEHWGLTPMWHVKIRFCQVGCKCKSKHL